MDDPNTIPPEDVSLRDDTTADPAELFEGLGARWHVWRYEERTGKRTKVPYQREHRPAKSNDPKTWGSIEAARAILSRGGFEGLGIQLGQLKCGRWLVGIDLDLCRDPVTGEIAAWAQAEIERFKSYSEVSPSGTGVKIFLIVDALPAACGSSGIEAKFPDEPPPANVPADGHEHPGIGLYPFRRYFTFTGQHLPGTPLEVAEATEAFGQLAYELRQHVPAGAALALPVDGDGPSLESLKFVRDSYHVELIGAPLTAELLDRVDCDPLAGPRWRNEDGHSNKNECDFRLADDLTKSTAGYTDSEIEALLREFPFGQMGSGKLTGAAADRQIGRCIAANRAKNPPPRDYTAVIDQAREKRQDDMLAQGKPVPQRQIMVKGKLHGPAATPGPRKLRRVAGMDYQSEPPRPMLVHRLLGEGETSIFSGAPKTGKSFLITDLALAITEGREQWFGYDIDRPGLVVYLVMEGSGGFPNRLEAHVIKQREKEPEFLLPSTFQYVPESLRFLQQAKSGGQVQFGPDIEAICVAMGEAEAEVGQPCVLLVVDTTARALTGMDENSNLIMGQFMEACAALAKTPSRPHVLCLAHTAKGGSGPRGGGAATGAAETLISVRRNMNDENKQRTWTVDDAKDDAGDSSYKFKLESVEIGADAKGRPLVSAVVVDQGPMSAEDKNAKGKKADPTKAANTDNEKIPDRAKKGNVDNALHKLRQLLAEEGRAPNKQELELLEFELRENAGKVKRIIEMTRWKAYTVPSMKADTEKQRTRGFEDAKRTLHNSKRVMIVGGFCWAENEENVTDLVAKSVQR